MTERDFGDTVTALRRERAVAAARLRGRGLSTRKIAAKLGVSHVTVLADLKTIDEERSKHARKT